MAITAEHLKSLDETQATKLWGSPFFKRRSRGGVLEVNPSRIISVRIINLDGHSRYTGRGGTRRGGAAAGRKSTYALRRQIHGPTKPAAAPPLALSGVEPEVKAGRGSTSTAFR